MSGRARPPGRSGPLRPFTLDEFTGESAADYRPADLAAEVTRLADPASATETLHWGRNYLYTVVTDSGAARREVVVKQFRNQGWWKRWKRRLAGSKAKKSWRAAAAVAAAGVRTPAPVAWIESRDAEGPSFYVCDKLDDFLEARYFFRALHAGRLAEELPRVDRDELLTAFGDVARRLHAAGIRYRDFSIGNLLVRWEGDNEQPEVYLVDLNRARIGRPPGTLAAVRDVSRLPILEAADRQTFLTAFGGAPPSRWRAGLFALAVDTFLARNRWKAAVRRPFKALVARVKPRRAHVHIPAPEQGASARDKIVWDPLTDQPHQHASRWERTRVRIADLGDHARTLGAALAAAPRVRRRYRALARSLHDGSPPWGVAGLAVRPHGPLETQVSLLEELGARHVLVRLHPWQERHEEEERLALALRERGFDLAFALPQNRDLVRDRGRWRAAVEELGERFSPYGGHFQVGQAINRSKWGVWSYGEYVELARIAGEVLRRHQGVEMSGPAVIDFEFHYLAGVLNRRAPGVFFDVVSSLLYVDRRGAPENAQLGFDTVGKALLLRALADTARNAAGRAWITEVNWPLWEGPHSPAGKSVSVDEESQADYLVRYFLAVHSTGLIERVYWWRLFARGFGLVDPGDGRLRPAFRAFRTMQEQLAGAMVTGPLALAEPARALRFRAAAGEERLVVWSLADPVRVELPGEVAAAVDRDGKPLAVTGKHITATGSPTYLSLL